MSTSAKRAYDYIVFWASCLAYTLAFIFICAAYLPGSVLHFKYTDRHIVSTLYPIRWDFYTGSAREPIYRLYHIENNKAISYDIRPFSSRFFFGLKRDSKLIASELEGIALDTAFVTTAGKYIINMPTGADINNYIHTDTLKYNNYQSANVLYLKGKILMSIEDCPSWQEQRNMPMRPRTVTLIPLNLAPGT